MFLQKDVMRRSRLRKEEESTTVILRFDPTVTRGEENSFVIKKRGNGLSKTEKHRINQKGRLQSDVM